VVVGAEAPGSSKSTQKPSQANYLRGLSITLPKPT